METESPTPGTAELSAAALTEWQRHVEHVLRGIAHSLNNRAAAVSAVLELASDPGDDIASTMSILRSEVERVTELAQVVRSIGAVREGAESFPPSDAVSEALVVLKLHAEREQLVAIVASAAPPIRVARWMFVRALIAFAANLSVGAPQARVLLTGEGNWLLICADGPAAAAVRLTPLVCELAEWMGGGALAEGNGFRVPTLAALRQREGR